MPSRKLPITGLVYRKAERGYRAAKPGESPQRYRVSWRDPSEKRTSQVFRTRKEAEAKYDAVASSLRDGSYIDPARARETFGQFYERWFPSIQGSHKPKTRDWIDGHVNRRILPTFRHRRLGTITKEDVRTFIGELVAKGDVSASTIQGTHRALSMVLSAAVEADIIKTNPANRLGGKHLPKAGKRRVDPYTETELERIADAIAPRFRTMILVLGYLGLRWGEVVALRVRDIDFKRGVLYVRRNVVEVKGRLTPQDSTKGGEDESNPRKVGIGALADDLREHLTAFSNIFDPEALVFSAPGGGFVRTSFRAEHFHRACDAVGVRRQRIHDLRHTAASIAFDLGASVIEVQEMLGHKDPVVTLKVYSHLLNGSWERLGGLQAAARAKARESLALAR